MADPIYRAGTETAAIVPEIWSAKWYQVLTDKLPFAEIIDRNYQGEISSLGDTVHISSIPEFNAAGELAEDAAGTPDAVTITSQALVIDKRTYKDYKITKLAQLQSLPFMDQLRDKAIFAINKRIQALIITAIVPSAVAPDHTISYVSGTTLSLQDILAAKELLDTQNTPEDMRFGVVGAAQYNDLFNITGRQYCPVAA
jgi:hypothetical protein